MEKYIVITHGNDPKYGPFVAATECTSMGEVMRIVGTDFDQRDVEWSIEEHGRFDSERHIVIPKEWKELDPYFTKLDKERMEGTE